MASELKNTDEDAENTFYKKLGNSGISVASV